MSRDFDDDDWDPRPRRRDVSKGRVYVHDECGGYTRISGMQYVHICDPFWPCTGTYCTRCRRYASLGEVYWYDTGEDVFLYRRRMWRKTPGFVRAWRLGLGLVIGALIGTIPVVVIAALMRIPMFAAVPLLLLMAVLCALIVYFLGIPFLNKVFRIDYRQMG